MFFEVITVISIEVLAICCFLAGFIFGRHSEKSEKPEKKDPVEKIVLDNSVLDPVTPEDQQLMKKLDEEEAKHHVQKDED